MRMARSHFTNSAGAKVQGFRKVFPRAPSIQIVPTLGSKVYINTTYLGFLEPLGLYEQHMSFYMSLFRV